MVAIQATMVVDVAVSAILRPRGWIRTAPSPPWRNPRPPTSVSPSPPHLHLSLSVILEERPTRPTPSTARHRGHRPPLDTPP